MVARLGWPVNDPMSSDATRRWQRSTWESHDFVVIPEEDD